MTTHNKICIGIIFGGQSNEHDISIESARTVFQALNSDKNEKKFVTKAFYVNKSGKWFCNNDSLSILKKTENSEDSNFNTTLTNCKILDQIDCEDIDIWFPIIHGTNGEDGTIQGLLKLTQKPFISSNLLGSALGMDKIAMKLILSHFKIPQVDFFIIQDQDLSDEKCLEKICSQILNRFNLPFFVKPSNSGSSIGISKVKVKSELLDALQKAWLVDHRIIIEEGLDVREFEVGIIGKLDLKASEVGEVSYCSDWYDYKSKYKTDNEILIPAEINKDLKQRLQTLSIQSCKALGINIYARADFFLEKSTNRVFLNEINTIPGFTSNSMFPMLWKASGLEIDELIARLVKYSL